MSKPKLDIQETPGFQAKVNRAADSGKPYTIKVEIRDINGGRYSAEFDMLQGGYDSLAMQKGIVACFNLCEALPTAVILQDVTYMATA